MCPLSKSVVSTMLSTLYLQRYGRQHWGYIYPHLKKWEQCLLADQSKLSRLLLRQFFFKELSKAVGPHRTSLACLVYWLVYLQAKRDELPAMVSVSVNLLLKHYWKWLAPYVPGPAIVRDFINFLLSL